MEGLYDFQQRLAHETATLSDWDTQARDLLDVVRNAKPSVLIGVSGQSGLFTEEVIKTLHAGCAQPLVMPLSNPTSKVEAVPQDLLDWTQGEALVATGSPFPPVRVGERDVAIAQCNNAYIFPGIGLGVVATNASRVTDKMLMAASNALAQGAPIVKTGKGALLPSLGDIREISKDIAFAVAKQAQEEEVALSSSDEALWDAIERHFWYPRYRAYRRRAF